MIALPGAEGVLRLEGRKDARYEDIAKVIEAVPGVLGHGLVYHGITAALVASPAGPRLLSGVCPWGLLSQVQEPWC